MPYAIGIALALGTGFLGRLTGMDRDRAFYPTVLIVVALFYVLFAAMGGSTQALVIEVVVMSVFAALAIVSFRTSLWLAAVMLAGHGLFDFFVHARLVSNPGMPSWWPAFCGAYDVAIGPIVAWLLYSGALRARAQPPG